MQTNFIKTLCFQTVSLLFIAAVCLPHVVLSQPKKPGSIEYLKACNGYKGIFLGADIGTLPPGNLMYLDGNSRLDTDSCFRFEFKDENLLKLPDGNKLDLIAIRTYNNKIINIYLFFKRNDGYAILSNFLSSFGLFTNRPNDYVDVYNWNTSKISLSLRYQLKTSPGIAIFSCKPLEQEIALKKVIRARKEKEMKEELERKKEFEILSAQNF